MNVSAGRNNLTVPVLLFNGECAVCRRIGHWVAASAAHEPKPPNLIVQPIGDDPAALRQLSPNLDIWDAYETIHILMPDGTMKLGGEAVAEVLRRLPNCRWFSWMFALKIVGVRPFQLVLNLGYLILADARPILGCASCGIPNPWVKFVGSIIRRLTGATEKTLKPQVAHFSSTPTAPLSPA